MSAGPFLASQRQLGEGAQLRAANAGIAMGTAAAAVMRSSPGFLLAPSGALKLGTTDCKNTHANGAIVF
jgi:hypothetical protein